jgi:SPOR domain
MGLFKKELMSGDVTPSTSWGSRLTACFLFVMLFIFVAGYYLGKMRALEQFHQQWSADSFADRLYASLYSFPHSKEEDEIDQDNKDELDSALSLDEEKSLVQEAQEQWYAQLAGFGKREVAQRYVDSLIKRQIPAKIIERKSKTSRGKTIHWYQVITQPMDREELTSLVNLLEETDHLKDVKISKASKACMKGCYGCSPS